MLVSSSKKKVTRKDYEILDLLINNPCIKINELSKLTKVSRVTLRRRLKTYDRKKLLKRQISLNKENLGITFAIISANFKSVQALENHINVLKECPHVLALITNVGQYDLTVIIYGLSEQQTRSFFLNNFYSEYITFKNFIHVPAGSLIYPQYIRIDIPKQKQCRKNCDTCKFYKDGLCKGCISHLKLRSLLKEF